MITWVLLLHIFSFFFSHEIEIQFWHIVILFVSIALYVYILLVVRREYFIQGVSEEEFGEYLIDFLEEQRYSYRPSEKSFLPDIAEDVPMKAFYIYLTKTAYVRVQTYSLLHTSKTYFMSRFRQSSQWVVSYERFLYGCISLLLFLSAFRFIPYF
ncbi:MAG: hypothetical protein PHI40_01260 [Caldisericia bacterium]|nr:hypothetical protein [Caldisericia bacterium]MDD4614025.1 hypothetical protein [Caldisericia bacterium]